MSTNGGAALPEVRTLIDELLTEQRELSAVERFSRAHDAAGVDATSRRHRDLIPLSAPRPGEQYGFEVDLDRCSGCKGCVTACHSLNGLDDDESWRKVGVLLGEVRSPASSDPNSGYRVTALQHTVTTACHHCVEPACLLGCPVLAYDKDPITGIVRHLDDQCIGCSYCILKCPYEVPQFSAKRGIVRKCDMCQGRLAVGEAPACVQACPNEAIRITTVETQWARIHWRQPKVPVWLPDAPEPSYTLPTTRYLSKNPLPEVVAGDHFRQRASCAHWPLLLMLVLTQIGMGGMLASALLRMASTAAATFNATILYSSLGCFLTGLTASVFHLGRPLKAWRVWLGWRTSWMSREAIALNGVVGLAFLDATLCLYQSHPELGFSLLDPQGSVLRFLAVVVPAGLVGGIILALVTQIMVYVDTHRAYWAMEKCAPRFAGTVLASGALVLTGAEARLAMAAATAGILLLKLAFEARSLREPRVETDLRTEMTRSRLLSLGPLRAVWFLRVLTVGGCGLVLLFASALGLSKTAMLGTAGGLFLLGELAERWLFFSAVSPDRMPGLP